MGTGAGASEDRQEADFRSIIGSAQVLSRAEVVARSGNALQDYDPIGRATEYMQRAVQFEESWTTILQSARSGLLTVDARQLYLDFLTDISSQLSAGSPRSDALAQLAEQVGVRGLGLAKEAFSIRRPSRGGTRWQLSLDRPAIERHLMDHIVGEHFLNVLEIDSTFLAKRPPLVAASDVSQHRNSVPVPAKYFRRRAPFVLNNAAGSLYLSKGGQPNYENVVNPKPDESLLQWMLIDPSYQDELDPEDYDRCVASAMDVGQYRFDHDYLMMSGKMTPKVIFRDGSIFPQDAYIDNFFISNRRGEFTRDAIRELLSCLTYARELQILYGGVVKNVRLRVYSPVVDWYITRHIDPAWDYGGYTLNDGQAMSVLLPSPDHTSLGLEQCIATCFVRRSFTTRANLNTKTDADALDGYLDQYQDRHLDIDLTPYRRLCRTAHLYMFFLGHSISPQQLLPRYEFFYTPDFGSVINMGRRILSAIRYCGLMVDEDHSFMSDAPVTYLIPAVTHHAHLLSKNVGKQIDTDTGQWIMSRFKRLVSGDRLDS